MDIQASYVKRFDAIREKVGKLSKHIDSLSDNGEFTLTDLCNSLPPREREELSYTLAHAITVLYTSLLRCQGTDASKHSISKESDRLKSYLAKLIIQSDRDAGRLGIDKESSVRMIQHHLNQ